MGYYANLLIEEEMNENMKIKEYKKPFSCKHCGKPLGSKQALNDHIKDKHPQEQEVI